jgi:hypothetical protein
VSSIHFYAMLRTGSPSLPIPSSAEEAANAEREAPLAQSK